jgi:hypothetical protein
VAHHLGVRVQCSERIKITRLPSPQDKAGGRHPVEPQHPSQLATDERPEDDHSIYLTRPGRSPGNANRPQASLISASHSTVDLRNVRGTLFVLAEEQGQPRLGSSSGLLS